MFCDYPVYEWPFFRGGVCFVTMLYMNNHSLEVGYVL